MEFPNRADLHRAATKTNSVVIKILESQSHHIGWQSLRQFVAVRWVQPEAMFCQLYFKILSRTAKLTVNWCFNNDAPGVLILRLRDLHMDIAVFAIHADFLDKGDGNMKYLKLNPRSRGVERTRVSLRPTINSVDCDF